MSFLSSYKKLEKLCNDIYGDNRGVSSYIEDMENRPRGSHLVRNWEQDLKNLKHYRWVRNKIAHEPDCSEENMCEPEDAFWIEKFYSRIMNKTDPLAEYYQVTKVRNDSNTVRNSRPAKPQYQYEAQPTKRYTSVKIYGWSLFIIIVAFIVLFFAFDYLSRM